MMLERGAMVNEFVLVANTFNQMNVMLTRLCNRTTDKSLKKVLYTQIDRLNNEWTRYEKHTEAPRSYDYEKHRVYYHSLGEKLLKARKLYDKYKHTLTPINYEITTIDPYAPPKPKRKRKKSN